ncbi:hypothetical protein F6Y03_30520 [Bacillus megaterium]|nr:hypothetical protein [Priestia megaterium]
MISQVENKEMIGQAYLHGIDTYIQNRSTVMKCCLCSSASPIISPPSARSSQSVKCSKGLSRKRPTPPFPSRPSWNSRAEQLLLLLGVAGEAGSADVLRGALVGRTGAKASLCANCRSKSCTPNSSSGNYGLPRRNCQGSAGDGTSIRRLVLQAFTHLASLGLTDYTNPTFEHFAPRLFDFRRHPPADERTRTRPNGDRMPHECAKVFNGFLL